MATAKPDDLKLDQRVTVLERGHELLADQMAEVAADNRDMADKLEAAIERALDKAVSKLISNAQQRAAEKTGLWVWGVVKGAAARWFVILAIVITVGKYAGWSIASAVFDSIIGKGKP